MGRYFIIIMSEKKIVLVLARGGSKEISRLNLRLVNEKPLLYYILKTCLQVRNADVFVSTDSQVITALTLLYGGKVIQRPRFLTKDSTKIEEIVNHALKFLKKNNKIYQKCFVVSPIFPTLKIETIDKFFNELSIKKPTIFGVTKDYNYKIIESKTKRLSNIKNEVVNVKKIVSFMVEPFQQQKHFPKSQFAIQLDRNESLTINDYHDLSVLEKILTRKKILVRVDGDEVIGLGHVYNILTILNYLRDEEILIVMNSKRKLGNYKFKQHNYRIKYFSYDKQLYDIIDNFKPNIIFNDILNTSENYIKNLKTRKCFVVNFEDLGEGASQADLVFNPIYYSSKKQKKTFFGSEYACVRDEFRIWNKKRLIHKEVKKVLITFGGADRSNITLKILKAIRKSTFKKINFIVVLGIGYSHKKEIMEETKRMKKEGFSLRVLENSDLMAKYISESDFVITSNGRTVFEVASLKIPMITISTNEREDRHLFSKYSYGTISLSHTEKLDSGKILDIMHKIMEYKTRKKLVESLNRYDLFGGVQKILDKIKTEYQKLEELQ